MRKTGVPSVLHRQSTAQKSTILQALPRAKAAPVFVRRRLPVCLFRPMKIQNIFQRQKDAGRCPRRPGKGLQAPPPEKQTPPNPFSLGKTA
jgi:hypothetical protein